MFRLKATPYRCCALVWLLLILAACATLNVPDGQQGGDPGDPGNGSLGSFGPRITSFTVSPMGGAVGFFAGLYVQLQVSFANGTAPYSLQLELASLGEDLIVQNVTSPYELQFRLPELAEEGRQTLLARLTDASGHTNVSSCDIEVQPAALGPDDLDDDGFPDWPKVKLSLAQAGPVVQVKVKDPAGQSAEVELVEISGGLDGQLERVTMPAGEDSVSFLLGCKDGARSASGDLRFKVTPKWRDTLTMTGSASISFAPSDADALAAGFAVNKCAVHDTVKVVVRSGPLANPFQYMTGVTVVFPPGCHYEAQSYDYGAPDPADDPAYPHAEQDQQTVDGIWSQVNPAAGFLPVGDNLLVPDSELPEPFEGRQSIDFNITPLDGHELPAGSSGVLFNFNLSFSQPGIYHLDFMLFDDVRRTYYQDGSQQIHEWSDLSNNQPGSYIVVR